MYRVRIKTKYNIIELIVENPNDPEMQELYYQPYVEEVYIETTHHYEELEKKLTKSKRSGNIYNVER